MRWLPSSQNLVATHSIDKSVSKRQMAIGLEKKIVSLLRTLRKKAIQARSVRSSSQGIRKRIRHGDPSRKITRNGIIFPYRARYKSARYTRASSGKCGTGYFPSGKKTFASALNLRRIALQREIRTRRIPYIGLTRGTGTQLRDGGGIRLHVRQVMDRE